MQLHVLIDFPVGILIFYFLIFLNRAMARYVYDTYTSHNANMLQLSFHIWSQNSKFTECTALRYEAVFQSWNHKLP